LVITESHVFSLANNKIEERGITNGKTITAILDVAMKCKQIGGTDWEKAQNYVICIVEDKMKQLGDHPGCFFILRIPAKKKSLAV